MKRSNVQNLYYKERRRIQAAILRASKAGFSGVTVPEIPKKITSASVERLKRMTTTDIYRGMTKKVEIETYGHITGKLIRSETVDYSYYRNLKNPEELANVVETGGRVIRTTAPGFTEHERKSRIDVIEKRRKELEFRNRTEQKYERKAKYEINIAKKKKKANEGKIAELNKVVYDIFAGNEEKISAMNKISELGYVPDKYLLIKSYSEKQKMVDAVLVRGAIGYREEPVPEGDLPTLEYYTHLKKGEYYSVMAENWSEKRSSSFWAMNCDPFDTETCKIGHIMNGDFVEVLTNISKYVFLKNNSEKWTTNNFPSLKYDAYYDVAKRHFYYIIPVYKK